MASVYDIHCHIEVAILIYTDSSINSVEHVLLNMFTALLRRNIMSCKKNFGFFFLLFINEGSVNVNFYDVQSVVLDQAETGILV